MLNKKYNYLLYLFALIFSLHLLFSLFISDTYSVDRILITTSLFFILIGMLIFNNHLLQNNYLLSNPIFLLMVFTLVQSLYSLYIDNNFEVKQQQFITISYLVMLIVILTNYTSTISTHLKLVFYVSCVSVVFILYRSYILQDTILDVITSIFNNIRVFNHIQTITIPSLALLFALVKNNVFKVTIVALLFFNFYFLFETGARGSLVAILTSFILLFLTSYNIKRIRNNLYVVAATFIISLVFYSAASFLLLSSGHSQHLIEMSSAGRMMIYLKVAPEILNSSYIIDAIGFSSIDIAVTHFLHPHNLFLYVFLGSGTLGLIVFIIILSLFSWKLLRSYLGSSSIVNRYFIATFFAVFLHSMVSGIYITPLASLLIITLLSHLNGAFFNRDIGIRNKKLVLVSNMIVVLSIAVLSMYLLKENLDLKAKYAYNLNDEKEGQNYHPGILLSTDKIYNKETK